MRPYLLLLAPAANRVYAEQAPRLAAAELAITTGADVSATQRAGVDYLSFSATESPELLRQVATQSAGLALFEADGELLRPVQLPRVDLFDDDLVTIPKYAGKTNEQFTSLLLNVTMAAARLPEGQATVLDPLCGRGTTLLVGWQRGLNGAGVDADEKAVEALASYLKTYLRRKRIKHTADMTPVRREGRSLGKRFDAEVRLPEATVSMGVFTGDTRASAKLWGKRRFDLVVADAPYGVVHGSQTDVRGVSGKRDRSAAGLLGEAVGVWAGQLKPGGALGLSWNTYGISREALIEKVTATGLQVRDDGPWRDLSHRVDSSIQRDVLVAVKLS